ncbi:MAG: hypothetical protein WKF41_04905 [Gaiellaceae bacterium]
MTGSVRQASNRQVRRHSRVAFAAAMTVMMLGTFASFGALSYAATGASETVQTVKRIVHGQAPPVRKTSAASDQYAPKANVAVVVKKKAAPAKPVGQVLGAVAAPNAQVASSGELPFTGLSLGATAILGFGLIGLGVFLRRREASRVS